MSEPLPPSDRPISLALLGDPNSVHVRRWVDQFLDRGYRIALLVPADVEIATPYPDRVAIERYRPQRGRLPSQLRLIASGLSVRRLLRRLRPDILHVHYLTMNGLRAQMSGFHPYVVTVWGSDVLVEPRRSRRARLLARRALRSADLVTGISRHLVDAAIELGAPADRTRVLHFGIDVDRFTPAPAPASLRGSLGLDRVRVVFSPRLIAPVYRQDVIVDALPLLPPDVHLVMTRYAANAAEAAAIERQIERLGLGARVHFVPAIAPADMPDYYRMADVVVTVPESDAGPVTLVEALAVGRPVVCSDLPPVREWMAELDPEALVPVGDVAATAAALARALTRDEATRQKIAERGRAAVLARADERQTMAEMDRLYRGLVASRGTGGLLESGQ